MKAYHYGNFIGGQWLHDSEQKRDITDPATGELVGTAPLAGAEHTSKAIEAASVALQQWKQTTADERAEKMHTLVALMKQNRQELGELITREMGRPLSESLGEVDYAASFLTWFAEESKRIYGRIVPGKSENHRIQVVKQPVGVVAAITPWNFPASMITRKLAPALAAGCTFIVKPAEQTPLTALRLAELTQEAGIPRGVVNVVCADPIAFANTIMSDSRVRKVSFTGSTEVGRKVMEQSAKQIKRISLELGGHAPFIVCADADLNIAVDALLASKFRNSGQTCVCTNRVYVHDSIYDTFVKRVANRVQKLEMGNGFQPQTDIGPLIDRKGYEKVANQVEDALQKGARCLVGGKGVVNEEKNTYFFEPTVLIDTNEAMNIMTEETFGPVAPIQKFTDEAEAIALANNSPFGLAAYIFTQNVSKGQRLAEELEYGIVGWNDGVPSTAQAPFGGVKQSGLGREGAAEGIEEYVITKYISIKI
jgi:succinate-semialdehyde dehydrogenase/glutarate-semialdehyde dehydrogenase